MNRKLLKLIATTRNTNGIKQLLEKAPVFLVGGCVRDIFLDKVSKDIDLVVENLSIEEILTVLKPFGEAKPAGVSFQVIKFKPFGFKGEPFDIARPRKDIKVGKGHKGFKTVLVKSINEDLKRRDFTINSIAVNLKNAQVIDPFDGLQDLKKGLIRATDKSAFIEDPLRIMRAIQFAARFDFNIEKRTKHLMKVNAHLIREITGERILEELEKVMTKSGNTQLTFDLMEETDLDLAFFGQRFEEHRDLPQLDRVSFFLKLGQLGGVDAEKFFFERLSGDSDTAQWIKTLDNVLNIDENISEEDLRFELFKALKKFPMLAGSVLLPLRFDKVFGLMHDGVIPSSQKDLSINGNDIKELVGEGPVVGEILEKVIRASLMTHLNWKSREDSLNFLQRLL